MKIEKELVQEMLEEALSKALDDNAKGWTLQGLGMLRLYIDDEVRLHVWNIDYADTNASTLHTHPWHMYSEIVAGKMQNRRFVYDRDGIAYMRQKILCGPGGGLCDEPKEVFLSPEPLESYPERTYYTQRANEIHESYPMKGTVTVVVREKLADADHAFVFWPDWLRWGSAEPRDATPEEVYTIIENSLDTWF